jgi:lipid-binding SYLF domain-containing protein
MIDERTCMRMLKEWRALAVAVFSLLLLGSLAMPALAQTRQEADQLVEKARFTLDGFIADRNMGPFQDAVKQAQGILIVPQLLKGAFIIGASGGTGVFVAWDPDTKRWAGPAFYTMGGASFGFQIGGEASEVILLAMTQRGVTALLSHSVKLGADVGIAVGPVGAGASAASANISVDILSFSKSKGLYGGISLEGAVVATRDGLNEAYYGKPARPMDILIRGDVTSPASDPLIGAVKKYTGR